MEKVGCGMKLWGAGMESIGFEPRITSDVPGCGQLLIADASGALKTARAQDVDLVARSGEARTRPLHIGHGIKLHLVFTMVILD